MRTFLDGIFFADWAGSLDELARFSGVSVTRFTRDPATLAAQARTERDARIAATDWLIARHRDQQAAATATTLTAAQYTAVLTYRQALRDVPLQAGFPATINWPIF